MDDLVTKVVRADRTVRGLETRAEWYYDVPPTSRETEWLNLTAAPGWGFSPIVNPPRAQGRICADYVFLRGVFIKNQSGVPPTVFGYVPADLRPDRVTYAMASHPTTGAGSPKIHPVVKIDLNGEMSLEHRTNGDGTDVLANDFVLGMFGIHYVPFGAVQR